MLNAYVPHEGLGLVRLAGTDPKRCPRNGIVMRRRFRVLRLLTTKIVAVP